MQKAQSLGALSIIGFMLCMVWSLGAAAQGQPATFQEVAYADLAQKRSGDFVRVKNVRLDLVTAGVTLRGKTQSEMKMRYAFVAVLPDRAAAGSTSPTQSPQAGGPPEAAPGKSDGTSRMVACCTGRGEYLTIIQEMMAREGRGKEGDLLAFMAQNLERVLPRTDIQGRIMRRSDYSGVEWQALNSIDRLASDAIVIDETIMKRGFLDLWTTRAALALLVAGVLLLVGVPYIASRLEPRFHLST